jgi:WD40 repeat protein
MIFLPVISAKNRLVLRDAASLDVLRTEVIVSGPGANSKEDSIDTIIFSPDSQFILASDFKNGVTFVYKTGADKDSSTWKAKISEGMSGTTDIRWAPDSRHIITLAEYSVKLTIWSLIQKLVRYIKLPKRKEMRGL